MLLAFLTLLVQMSVGVGNKSWSFNPTCVWTVEEMQYTGQDMVLSHTPSVISLITRVGQGTGPTYTFLPPNTYRFTSGLALGDKIQFTYCYTQ